MHPLGVALPACLATRMPAVSDCAKYMGRKRRSVDNIRCNSAYLRRAQTAGYWHPPPSNAPVRT